MIREWTNRNVVVSRLRVVSPDDDALAVQLRMTNLLGGSRLEPPGLPPSTIVVIRKLLDPLPGRLPLNGPAGLLPLEWEQAVSGALDRMIRRAARPALGAVPADSEAVIFADMSEWLACLAADWCLGLVKTRWWWQCLLRRAEPDLALFRAWRDAPQSIPGALHLLANRRAATTFAISLSDDAARALLEAVVVQFGLSDVRAGLYRLKEHTADRTPQGGTTPQAVSVAGAGAVRTENRQVVAPWLPWAPESASAGLGRPARALLGIGLTLARAPAEVRAPAFARDVGLWVESITREEATRLASDASAQSDEAPLRPPPVVSAKPAASGQVLNADLVEDEHRAADAEPARPAQLDDKGDGAGFIIADGERRSTVEDPSPGSRGAHASVAAGELTVPDRSGDVGSSVVSITTEFGGLFYVINLGLFLGLYGDFTTPAEPGIALDLWDFVALIGLRLVGDEIRADPVWPLLARLAGRDEEVAPGREFAPDDEWRLAPEWLSAFPDTGEWLFEATGERLRVQHAEGFLVLDVRRAAGAIEFQLEQEMRAYSAVAVRSGSVRKIAAGDLPVERWLNLLEPYLRARLSRALGDGVAAELGQTLCKARARVFVTTDRLDVMLSMDEHPIAIRLAGLDRDPGWVPAAARFVAFHFE